jgi:hypothetical protein
MRRMTFVTTCQRGHRATYAYSARALREHLERGTLLLCCAKCDDRRPPTPTEALTLTRMVICSEAADEAGVHR